MKIFNLRIKVLIPATILNLSIIAAALFIINHVVRQQVKKSVANDLVQSKRILQELEYSEMQHLLERSQILAETPYLKAAVDTDDSSTVQEVAREVVETIRSDVLLILNQNDQILAQQGFVNFHSSDIHPDSLLFQTQAHSGKMALLQHDEKYYRIVIMPILARDEISGLYVLGRVLLGNAIDIEYMQRLQDLVECHVTLVVNEQFYLSTLDMDFFNNMALPMFLKLHPRNEQGISEIKLGEEAYYFTVVGKQKNYLLLHSIDKAHQAIAKPIENIMIVIGILALLAMLLISSFISRYVIAPVKNLVKVTNAVTSGDYSQPVEVRSHDEIGFLARKFDEMRQTLRQKMTLLKKQNVELEEALKKLAATQDELLLNEKLIATGKVTAHLSHELNNPIHNIQGCLEAALKKIKKSDGGREFVELAHREVQRIGDLVRQMLDFYRPQAAVTKKIDINVILREVLRTSKKMLNANNIQVSCKLDPEPNEIITAPDRLKQVFLNLIINAVDAMPGSGKLCVNSRLEKNKLSIIFEDTGHGISPEHKNKIFDAFFTTKSETSGVGLGLTVSHGIISSLGGKILVESEIKKGTRFIIELPLNGRAIDTKLI
ncbi:MAG: ATP-binding protein [bacterium]